MNKKWGIFSKNNNFKTILKAPINKIPDVSNLLFEANFDLTLLLILILIAFNLLIQDLISNL